MLHSLSFKTSCRKEEQCHQNNYALLKLKSLNNNIFYSFSSKKACRKEEQFYQNMSFITSKIRSLCF